MQKKLVKVTLCLVMAVMLLMGLATTAAATTVTPIDGKVQVADSANSNSLSNGVVTITAKGSLFSKKTNNITVTNTSGSKGTLSFSYEVTSANEFQIGGQKADVKGSISQILDPGASIAIMLKSNNGVSDLTATLKMMDFSFIEVADSSDVTVSFDSSLGSVTAAGNAASDGTVIQGVTKDDGLALTATAKSGVTFLGWIDTQTNQVLSSAADFTLYPTGTMTARAVFVTGNPDAWFTCGNGTYLFDDLNEATAFATSISNKTVVLAANGILPAGNYTIPAGVTLLIPRDAANTLYTEEPGVDANTRTAPTMYRTLNMDSGAKIEVKGAISLGGKQSSSISYNGCTSGTYGQIAMSAGSTIDVQNGGKLYAWGYITGSGSVAIQSGGTVYESFQFTDYRGGEATSDMAGNSQRVFPMSQFYLQNVEVPMTIYAGANEFAVTSIQAPIFGAQTGDVPVVSKAGGGAMFQISSGYIVKDYMEGTGRIHFETCGDVSISPIEISMRVAGLTETDIASEDYYLPIPGHFTVDAISGSVTINQDIALFPGSELILRQGTSGVLGAGADVVAYSWSDWGTYCDDANTKYTQIPFAPGGRGTTGREKDAMIQVDGTIDATKGKVYVTSGGANVFSTGTGVIYASATESSVAYQCTSEKDGDRDYVEYKEIAIQSPILRDGDGTTYQAAAADTYVYCAATQKWCPTTTHRNNSVVTAPTCTEEGYTTHTCIACGNVKVDSQVAATGHAYESVVVDPTCTEDGYTTHTCTACGDSYSDTPVDATGHTHEVTEEKAATCTEDGYKIYACSCGDTYTETLPAPGHNETSVVTDPTCTEQGYTTHTCSVCDNVRIDSYVDATGHNCGEGEITKAPTCTEKGVKTFACANCDYSYTEELDATGHKYGDEATCTTPQVCMVCSAELAAALGHKEVIDNAVPATCTETGLTEGKHCSVCNTVLVKQDVVDALGHSFTDWTVTVQPTYTTEGTQQRTCINGNHTETKPVPVLKMVNLWNLVLGEGVRMNFVANMTADQAENATVEVVVNGTSETFAMNNLPVNEEGFAVVTANVSAAQMTDTVTLIFTVNGEQVTKEYTVRQYADYVLDDANGFDDVTKALVQAMLHYGAAAQDYFDYNEGSFANLNIRDTVTNAIQNVEAVPATGETAGIVHYGSTLVYRDKVAVRVYFKLTGDAAIGDYTFTANGEKAKVNEGSNGLYYVEVADIAPQNLDKAVTVVVNGGLTVTYSPLNYICRMSGKTDDAALKTLLQQLYDYYIAAAAYTAK